LCFNATKWVRAQAFTDPLHRYLALEIADYADEHGKAWPSVATLASVTRLSKRTVQIKLAELEALGILRRKKRWKNGHQTSNLLTFAMCMGAPTAPCDAIMSARPAPMTPTMSARPAPEPSIKIEPPRKRERERACALAPSTPLPDGWIPEKQPADAFEQLAFTKMVLRVKARGEKAADWNAYWQLWLIRERHYAAQDRKQQNGKRSGLMGAHDRLMERLGGAGGKEAAEAGAAAYARELAAKQQAAEYVPDFKRMKVVN
jgi:hypothetical protein